MSTKCITITSEAYERLAALKEKKESFSDVIDKITNKRSLFELAGLLSDKEADKLETDIKELRKRMRKEIEKSAKELQ